MKEKLISLESAAGEIRDGDQIIMSARMEWAPMAMLRELARQGRRGLRLVGCVGGHINLDFPVGAGMAASIDTCSVHLGEFVRTAPNFSRHVTEGRIKALDNT